ncbi:hypothetical protein DFH11DRAFT_1880083 [Phellopilus nigrolimitatus]|nr:hypothetical protein DFH11DRAFT_1880083 [Phellopilus nigrolimitatus]
MANPTCIAAGLSPALCEELATLEASFLIIQATKWVNISALAAFIYDYVITFDEEVTLMWGSVFGPGKVLFFLNRYFGLATLLFLNIVMCLSNIPHDVSTAWIRTNWIAGTIVAAFAEMTLQLRLYAMYDRTWKILVLLIISCASTIGAMVAISVKIMKVEGATFQHLGDSFNQNMCTPAIVPNAFKTFWSPLLANEALLFSLAVYKGVRSLRRGSRMGNRLIRFLVRDSVLFFFIVFASFFANELVWLIGGGQYIEILVGFAIANASIWSQRLLLNIRKQYIRHQAIVVRGDLHALDYSHSSSGAQYVSHGHDRDIVLSTFRKLDAPRMSALSLVLRL